MHSTEILTLLAEVFVAFAGFTGIVAVLGQRSTGHWRSVDVVRFQSLLEASLSGLMLAVLPLLALEFGFSETVIWASGSAVLGIYVASLMIRVVRKQKALRAADDPDYLPGVRLMLLILSAIVIITQLMNAVGYGLHHAFAGYFVGLILLLFLCSVMFVLLLRFIRAPT